MTCKMEYYDEDSSSWKELDFENWKRKREINSFVVLKAKLPFKQSDGTKTQEILKPKMEIRVRIDPDTDDEVVMFGGYTKDRGSLTNKGKINLKVFGYAHHKVRDEADIDLSNTDNEEVIETMVGNFSDSKSGYSFSFNGASGDDAITYDINSYKRQNCKRSRVVREMENNYRWCFYISFLSGSPSCQFEPVGFYDSTETIDTSNEATQINEYKPGIIDDIVTKVKVRGTDSDGNSYSATKEESGPEGVTNYKKIRADYVTSDTECQNIATKNMNLEVDEKLEIETVWFKSNIMNEVVKVTDDVRNLDESEFIVRKQIDTYPEKRTKLVLDNTGIYREGVQDTYDREIKQRDERDRYMKQTTKPVGDQGYDVEHGDRNTTGDTPVDNIEATGDVDVGYIDISGATTTSDIIDNVVNNEDTHTHDVSGTTGIESTDVDFRNVHHDDITIDTSWTHIGDHEVQDTEGFGVLLTIYIGSIDGNEDVQLVLFNADTDTVLINTFHGTFDPIGFGDDLDPYPAYADRWFFPYYSSYINADDDLEFWARTTDGSTDFNDPTTNTLILNHEHEVSETDGATGAYSGVTIDDDEQSGRATSGDTDSGQTKTSDSSTDSGQTKTTDGSTDSEQTESGTTDSQNIIVLKEDEDDR